jgi:hypothetical protein
VYHSLLNKFCPILIVDSELDGYISEDVYCFLMDKINCRHRESGLLTAVTSICYLLISWLLGLPHFLGWVLYPIISIVFVAVTFSLWGQFYMYPWVKRFLRDENHNLNAIGMDWIYRYRPMEVVIIHPLKE